MGSAMPSGEAIMMMFVAGALCGACLGAVAVGICFSAISTSAQRTSR